MVFPPPLHSVNVVHWLISYIKRSLHSRNKSYLVIMYKPFNMLWIQSASILLRAFTSVFRRDIGLQSLWSLFVWLWLSGQCWPLNTLGSASSSSNIWKNLRSSFSSSLNVWYNSPMKAWGPGVFFSRRFLVTDSIYLLVINLFKFSISLWVSLNKFFVSRNVSISSRLPMCLAYNSPVYSTYYFILFLYLYSC